MIEILKPDWEKMKDAVSSGNLSWQYAETKTAYHIFATNGAVAFRHKMHKTTPPSTEQDDFETNYKAKANKPTGIRAQSFAANDVEFSGNGVQKTVPKGTTENIDFKLPETLLSSGGFLLAKDAVSGDFISAHVVDVDGVYAPAGTVLKTWIVKWFIFPDRIMKIERRQAGTILKDLYLRIKYTSIGATNDPLLTVNYILERPL